jgi:hypothetical protein
MDAVERVMVAVCHGRQLPGLDREKLHIARILHQFTALSLSL